ncbi:MAG: S9 family peptidase [Sandaracinus sp.]|nr:S9 family peptidase [Sandaracinus sp.]
MRAALLLFVVVSLACGETAPCPTAAPEAPPAPAGDETPAEPTAPEAPTPEPEGTVFLDGTPEVPASLRERLAQYQELRSASLLGIADDGNGVLVATRFAETAQLHFVGSPLGARRQLTYADEPITSARLVPNQPNHVVYLVDVGGDENHQVHMLDRSTGRVVAVTDDGSKHAALVVSGDGQRLAYAGNARNGTDMDLYVQPTHGAPKRIDREGYWYPLDFSQDGKKLLAGQYLSITDSRLFLVDLETDEVTRLSPEDAPASYVSAVFGPNDQSVYVISDRGSDVRRLHRFDPANPSAPWTTITSDVDWNVEELAIAADRRTLAFSTNEDGYSVLRLLDTRTNRTRLVRDVPRGIVEDLHFAARANVLGFTFESAARTADAYLYDVRRNRLTRWTESEIGGLDASTFVEPELIRYRSFDDREIPAFVYRPRGEGPFPVMVYVHGGPESQTRPWLSGLTQYLVVERGIAVVAPNVRGSDGYGKTYLGLDDGRLRENSVKDVGALLDWIGTQSHLDESRVGVYGGSYGGYMVLASLVHFGERLRAGVDVVGISNFVTFLESTREYRRDLRRAEYGDERDPEMRAFLQDISPLTHVDRIQSALFVAQGANDPRVPVTEAEQVVRAVRQSGRDVWYMLARNEGHGFRKKENRDLFTELTVLFFERHLLGEANEAAPATSEAP